MQLHAQLEDWVYAAEAMNHPSHMRANQSRWQEGHGLCQALSACVPVCSQSRPAIGQDGEPNLFSALR